MNQSDLTQDAGRILVGFQSEATIEFSVEAATLLASATRSEMVGMFVEDDALIELADLPIFRPLVSGASLSHTITGKTVVAAYARAEIVCRRLLSAHADRAQVRWSFLRERGKLAAAIRRLAMANDFIVVSGEMQGFGARQLIDELRASPTKVQGVLVAGARSEIARTGSVIAIDDGDEKGVQTVKLADRIRKLRDTSLMLLVIAGTDGEADRIIRRAKSLLGSDAPLSAHRLPRGSPELTADATRQFNPSFVVADRQGEPFVDDKAVLALLRASRAPVLLLS